jgi:DNA-binding transcriptional regulator YiaG
MAKDKKDKKKKSAKLPKEVAGVKVTKGLRKAGKAALKLASQPAVGEAVAAAMLAAAAALREGPAIKQGAKAAGDAAGGAAEEAQRQASGLGDALKAIAIDVARRTVEAWEEGSKKPAAKGPHEG